MSVPKGKYCRWSRRPGSLSAYVPLSLSILLSGFFTMPTNIGTNSHQTPYICTSASVYACCFCSDGSVYSTTAKQRKSQEKKNGAGVGDVDALTYGCAASATRKGNASPSRLRAVQRLTPAISDVHTHTHIYTYTVLATKGGV